MKRSTSVAISTLAIALATGSARADTIAFRPGFYAGGFAGWVNSETKATATASAANPASPQNTAGNPITDVDADGTFLANALSTVSATEGILDNGSEADGFVGGALIGYSVIGQGMFAAIEADLAFVSADSSKPSTGRGGNFVATYANPDDATLQTGDIVSIDSTTTGTATSKLTADSSIKIRFGTEIGYGMRIFALAGLALGRMEHRATLTKTDTIVEDNGDPNNGTADATRVSTVTAISQKWQTGWTLGGGLDVALWGPWSARVEYRYVDLGTGKLSVNFADGSVQTIKFEDTEQTVRFGLVYAF